MQNEYQDQETWFDLQVYNGLSGSGQQMWSTISDHDTREGAEARARGLWPNGDRVYRVRRTSGLGA